MIFGGIVGGYYGQTPGGTSEAAPASGTWIPVISELQLNNDETLTDAGSITISDAYFVGNGSRRHFEIYYTYTPPTQNPPEISSIQFKISLPTEFSIQDFYGSVEYYLNTYNSNGDAYFGESGGGAIFLADPTDTAPFTEGFVVSYFKNWATTEYAKDGIIKGVFAVQTS